MLRLIKYNLKEVLSQKLLVFWALFFPIILTTLFNVGFANINESNLFKTIDVIMIDNKDKELLKLMQTIKYGDKKMFNITNATKTEALDKLESQKVVGVIEVDGNKPKLSILNNDTSQTILKDFLDSYIQDKVMIMDVLKKNPKLVTSEWFTKMDFNKDYVKELKVSAKMNNGFNVSFYSAIAMGCLFGASFGVYGIMKIQPNLSYQGARLHISPYSKLKILFANFITNVLIVFTCSIVLILYMNNVLGIDISNQVTSVLLICLVGALFSVSYGYLVSLLLKKNESLKEAVIFCLTMFFSFLAGMMNPSVAYQVEQISPLLKYINPVSLITNSFTKLYYYDDFNQVIPNIMVLLLMFVACFLASVYILRGDKYDSI